MNMGLEGTGSGLGSTQLAPDKAQWLVFVNKV